MVALSSGGRGVLALLRDARFGVLMWHRRERSGRLSPPYRQPGFRRFSGHSEKEPSALALSDLSDPIQGGRTGPTDSHNPCF